VSLDLRSLAHVVVGSTNPVKIRAVRSALAKVAPAAAVDGIDVASGVPDQPWGDSETMQGAEARARAALESAGDAELAVGIEGGVVEMPGGGLRTCAWASVVSRDGRTSVGGSLAMPLPPEVAKLVREGVELGDAMDRVTGERETKRGAGAVGILTGGIIDRQRAYEVLVAYALAPFISAELW